MVFEGQEKTEMAWQIIGHEWAVELLQQSLATGRVAHAYLFTGPPQVGKRRLALGLAQALNCTGSQPPCGQCPSCLKLVKGTHPDVRVIEGEGAGGSIKIDQVRALQREAILSPYEGRYRVYILRHVDLASPEAANSLLKILEEPPEHVVLVLTAVQPEALPATVVSRCQRLDLKPVAHHVLESVLRDRGVAEPQAQLLVRLSGGRVGWVLDASREETALGDRQRDLDQMIQLLTATRVERLDFAWEISRNPDAGRALLELWMVWWRDLLLMHNQGQDHVINIDRSDDLGWMASQSTMHQVRLALHALQSAAAQLKANVNARLAWEGLVLNLPRFRTPPQQQGEQVGAGKPAPARA
jgi:DNA polymerase-3 subunit delta'